MIASASGVASSSIAGATSSSAGKSKEEEDIPKSKAVVNMLKGKTPQIGTTKSFSSWCHFIHYYHFSLH